MIIKLINFIKVSLLNGNKSMKFGCSAIMQNLYFIALNNFKNMKHKQNSGLKRP